MKENSRKLFAVLVVLAMLAAILTACGSTPEPQVVKETVVVAEKETVVVTEKEEVEVTKEVPVEVTREVVKTTRGTGGTLTILFIQATSTLNPYLAAGGKDLDAASVILEPLARFDETGKMLPWLAKEIPTLENGGVAEDLKSITWQLREGVLWSDGTPLTAEDVAFTIDYCTNEEMGCRSASHFSDIDSVEVLDDLTVKINFSVPKPYPYGPCVGVYGPIIQKAQFEDCTGAAAQQCTEQNFGPIGTGPFKVKEFRANDVIVYEVNDNYRDPNKPFFSEVIIKGGGDAASAARAVLVTGEADYAPWLVLDPQVLGQMQQSGQGKVVTSAAAAVEHLMLNLTNPDPALGDKRSEWTEDDPNPHPILSDPAVRQALSLAIDRNLLVAMTLGPFSKPTCNIVPAPPMYASTANDECLTQDIERANQILDDAGWLRGADGVREKDGVRLRLLFQTSTSGIRQAEQALLKQFWGEIGVETELRNIAAAVFFGGDPASPDTYVKFYAEVEMFANGMTGGDPEPFMTNWLCERIPRRTNQWLGMNVPRYCNPEYDALIAKMAVTADPQERADLTIRMNDMLVQSYALIPLRLNSDVSAHSNTLLGVRLNSWDAGIWNIADWTRAQTD